MEGKNKHWDENTRRSAHPVPAPDPLTPLGIFQPLLQGSFVLIICQYMLIICQYVN